MCPAQGPQRSDAGEAQTRGPSVSGLESSTLPLKHCAPSCICNRPIELFIFQFGPVSSIIEIYPKLAVFSCIYKEI